MAAAGARPGPRRSAAVMVVRERPRRGPEPKVRDQDNRQHEPASERPRDRDPPAGRASASTFSRKAGVSRTDPDRT